MEQRDYLMRQIEQLGQVLAEMFGRLLRIRKAGSASLSINEIRSIYSDELDLTLDLVLQTPADEIIEVLTSRVKFMDRHLEKMAEILAETADLFAGSGLEDEARDLREKCIIIYENMQENTGAYSLDRMMKISRLKELL
jgi:hypothetical protein